MSSTVIENQSLNRRSPAARMLIWIGALLLFCICQSVFSDQHDVMRIATWNLEHLNDENGAGCITRDQGDYEAIAGQIREIDPDVVAFQEVENKDAAHRVFPKADWWVVVSNRSAPLQEPRECWEISGKYLHHQATGFAIRKRAGLVYERQPDLESLGGDPSSFQRWGTGIIVTLGERSLRLLSVHLKSGCWSSSQDRSKSERTVASCATLTEQIGILRDWADAREQDGIAFGILGDFNRRFAVEDDRAWTTLSPGSSPLELLTADITYDCAPRFDEFIDHIVLDADAVALLVPNSTHEWLRDTLHPDHCAVSADLQMQALR